MTKVIRIQLCYMEHGQRKDESNGNDESTCGNGRWYGKAC